MNRTVSRLSLVRHLEFPQAGGPAGTELRLGSSYGYDLRLFVLNNSLDLSACCGHGDDPKAVQSANSKLPRSHSDEGGRTPSFLPAIPTAWCGFGGALRVPPNITVILPWQGDLCPPCGNHRQHTPAERAGRGTSPWSSVILPGADLPHLCQTRHLPVLFFEATPADTTYSRSPGQIFKTSRAGDLARM